MQEIDSVRLNNETFILEIGAQEAQVRSNGRTWKPKDLSSFLTENKHELSENPAFLANAVFYMLLQNDYQMIENSQIESEKTLYKKL